MDAADMAQLNIERTQSLNQKKYFDLAPVPPAKHDCWGKAVCVDCDVNIVARRRVVPNAQRCVECQSDHEKRRR
jgi:RNA polymerase-binding transcription factor DksA